MRLRNIKDAKHLVEANPIVIKENIFHNKPLHIEIGCGKGNFIIKMSENFKDINFIGIEKYPSVLIKAIQKVDKLPDNLRFMCLDAINLDQIFKNDVDVIYLNFSDPWPKKRHCLRRLTSPVFLEKYEIISKENLEIFLKTDNQNFFAYSLQMFNNNGYLFKDISLNLDNSNIYNIETEYEVKFRNLNIPINYLHAVKKINK